ncbi:MAG: hypothetical protein LBV44_00930 [Methylobacillus sp.]|jgi:hypothetical protein|nr:hypothetical protein [Methylobacillus sp.]
MEKNELKSMPSLEETLRSLEGKVCWSVIAGRGTGSHVSMHFGKKIPMSRPLKNTKLTEEERNFEGEFGLFIQMCSWRLEDGESVICSCHSPNDEGEEMLFGLKFIIGKKLLSAKVKNVGKDLDLLFEKNIKLLIFSTQMQNGYHDYSVFHTGNFSLIVGPKGHVAYETNEPT